MSDEKKYNVVYLPVAKKDLLEIIEYIQNDNPSAASDFVNKLDKAISKLKNFPYLGQVPKDTRLQYLNYRMLIIESYLVFYVVKDNFVEIRRILHGRRKYSFLL